MVGGGCKVDVLCATSGFISFSFLSYFFSLLSSLSSIAVAACNARGCRSGQMLLFCAIADELMIVVWLLRWLSGCLCISLTSLLDTHRADDRTGRGADQCFVNHYYLCQYVIEYAVNLNLFKIKCSRWWRIDYFIGSMNTQYTPPSICSIYVRPSAPHWQNKSDARSENQKPSSPMDSSRCDWWSRVDLT